MKNIVFTGGTHVGKTSVLEYLEKFGYKRNISVAGKNMESLNKLLGNSFYKEWREKNFLDFQKMNIFDDIKLFIENSNIKETKNNIIFFDRGVFDWIASLKRENIKIPEEIEELIKNISYFKKVFLFEEIGEHNTREQTGRLLNLEVSRKWNVKIEEEYKKRGYEIIKVPNLVGENTQDSIKMRAEFVLNNI